MTKDNIKIGLVTVLYRSNDVLSDFFKSISVQEYKYFSLFIIDNSPSLETSELIKTLIGKYKLNHVKHIENKTNIGIAAANNIGIKLAFTEGCNDVILLNNDIFFDDPKMFLDLVKFASSSNAHIISPKIYFYNSNILWYGGGYILPYQVDIRQKGYMTKDDSQFDLIQETGFAPGCFIYIKGEVFEKIGLMDEKYFVYVEDTDFILRAIKAGFRIVYYPKHHLYHKVGISTGGLLSDFYLYYNTRNRIYFARKHFPLIKKTIAISYVILSMIIKSVFRKDMKLKKLLFRSFRDGFNR